MKVIVQPVFVLDDGEVLTERIADPMEIPAAEWDKFPEQLMESVERMKNDKLR